MEVIPDPTTVYFHLPNNLSVRVHRQYSEFITELNSKFPHEKEGILKFYSLLCRLIALMKAPSFLSIHMGIKSEVLPPDTYCHHLVLENSWTSLEETCDSIFLSIPTILDPSLAPECDHILHIFTTSSMDDWKGLSRKDYDAKKELVTDRIINILEQKLFPGLASSIDFKGGLENKSPVLDVALLRPLGWLRSLA